MDSVIQIKKNLITRIKNSSDLNFLKALQALFDQSEMELFELTEKQIQAIDKARKEIKNGNFIENSQAISDLRQWLKKK